MQNGYFCKLSYSKITMEKKKLFLIDAMALIYRSFYAMNKNPRMNTKGLNTSAAFGFFNTLLSLLKQHKPSYLGIAFDLHAPTFRHECFADYKANRESTPEEIRQMEPYIHRLIEAMHIPMLSCEGYEADDVIGTLAKKAAREGFEVFMVTPDKDYAQLVEENIKMLKLGRMGAGEEIWGVDEVLQRFEIKEPKQVIDILGLWGDSSDNIPGVPGIGEKKAKALLQQFASIEEIVENSDKITAKSVRKAIEENKEQALQSKFLATIVLNVPIEFNPEALAMSEPDVATCRKVFDELEFKGLAKSFFDYFKANGNSTEENNLFSPAGQENLQTDLFSEQSSFDNIANTAHEYSTISTFAELNAFIEKLQEVSDAAFHCHRVDEKFSGVAICTEKGNVAFIDLSVFTSEEVDEALSSMKTAFFENESIHKIAYDLKKEMHSLSDSDISIKGECFDVLIAHYLLDSEAAHRLDLLSEGFLNYRMLEPTEHFGKSDKPAQRSIPVQGNSHSANHCSETADIIFRLRDIFERKLEENNLSSLFRNIEMPLVEVLFSMEKTGVRIDTAELETFSGKLGERKAELERKIYDLAGLEFNIASPKQMGEVLFERLQIAGNAKTKKTATKQFSTAEDVLQKYIHVHPIIPLILEYRTLSKLKSTYVDALPALVSPKSGRVHTSFNQAVTATGRLSSNNPNLQNIPIKTELGKEIRRCFVPADDEHVLLAADYSQIELRIIASLSGDEHLCSAFKNGEDIHLATAAKIYGLDSSQITKQMRANVKSVNFGIIYGISAFGLSNQLGISRKEAQSLIDQYFENYPQVAAYIEQCKQKARQKGYAESMCGRKRYLKDINSGNVNLRAFAERNAVNMPIQASSADMIKIAMSEIYRRLKKENLKSKMILQVHDELVFDVCKSELEKVNAIVVNEMTNALKLEVPIVVNAKSGANWLEAH